MRGVAFLTTHLYLSGFRSSAVLIKLARHQKRSPQNSDTSGFYALGRDQRLAVTPSDFKLLWRIGSLLNPVKGGAYSLCFYVIILFAALLSTTLDLGSPVAVSDLTVIKARRPQHHFYSTTIARAPMRCQCSYLAVLFFRYTPFLYNYIVFSF